MKKNFIYNTMKKIKYFISVLKSAVALRIKKYTQYPKFMHNTPFLKNRLDFPY
ncbi:hypothetical protein HMPREF0023_0494 [Acinetobacter sp. ATCC 27244]|nr:hypothetical protein HMPREF0023_0494 [Acinetobacter sp. ATCC 27244]